MTPTIKIRVHLPQFTATHNKTQQQQHTSTTINNSLPIPLDTKPFNRVITKPNQARKTHHQAGWTLASIYRKWKMKDGKTEEGIKIFHLLRIFLVLSSPLWLEVATRVTISTGATGDLLCCQVLLRRCQEDRVPLLPLPWFSWFPCRKLMPSNAVWSSLTFDSSMSNRLPERKTIRERTLIT